MAAGDNEKILKKIMHTKFGSDCLSGKKRFVSEILYNDEKVEISVDDSIELEEKTVLIEIDSGNMAKLVAGQYALLNHLCSDNRSNTIFLVIHFHIGKNEKRYNAERTKKKLICNAKILFRI